MIDIELKLAVLSNAILKTKWYQVRKRNRLYKKAKELARIHGIEY
jgi:hypothetical protein